MITYRLFQMGATLIALSLLPACSGHQNDLGRAASEDRTKARGLVEPGALFRAAANGNTETVADLIARGADLDENLGTRAEQVTPLLAAIVNGHGDAADLLIHAGAKVYPLFRGYSAKDFALFLDQPRIVRSLTSLNHRSQQ
jgi:hypothetical protein